jgi:hypothetical protein
MRSTTSRKGGDFAFDLAVDRNGVQPLGPAPADKRTVKERLRAWLTAGHTRREMAAKNAADLLDRFGPAAPGIARNCAHQAVGLEERRLWAMVVRMVSNRAPGSEIPSLEQ